MSINSLLHSCDTITIVCRQHFFS